LSVKGTRGASVRIRSFSLSLRTARITPAWLRAGSRGCFARLDRLPARFSLDPPKHTRGKPGPWAISTPVGARRRTSGSRGRRGTRAHSRGAGSRGRGVRECGTPSPESGQKECGSQHQGEPELGLSSHPGCTGSRRASSCAQQGQEDPARARHRSGSERSKKKTWSQFLRTHWDVLGGGDFFTVEVWMPKGLVTFYVFFVIELRSRAIRILGWTPNPDRSFMRQMALELAEHERPFPAMRRVIIDRDGKDTKEFEDILAECEIKVVKIPARSPNCNPHAERFVRSICEECLDRVVLFGEGSPRRALRQYETHYVRERSHQGIGNRLVSPDPGDSGSGEVECRPRLGGLLRFYRRAAA